MIRHLLASRSTWNGTPFTGASFDFGEYMLQRANIVNQALDEAIPAVYPETLTEAMRYASS